MLYLLDLYPRGAMPDTVPPGIFPPGVHICFQAASLPVPGYLQPPTVAYVPMAQQNPVENLNMVAEGANLQPRSLHQVLVLGVCLASGGPGGFQVTV